MKKTKTVEMQEVADIIERVTGKTISKYNENLLGKNLAIMPVDFLYILDEINLKFGANIYKTLEYETYECFR